MPLPFLRSAAPSDLISRVSVRTRIVAIAVIPVIGFLANGIAFTSGEAEVGGAFQSAQQAAALADASREFKVALTSMRMSAKEFAAQPSYDLVAQFGASHDGALRSLDTIESAAEAEQRGDIAIMRVKVETLKHSFGSLIREQEELGFAESEGLHERLSRAGRSSLSPREPRRGETCDQIVTYTPGAWMRCSGPWPTRRAEACSTSSSRRTGRRSARSRGGCR